MLAYNKDYYLFLLTLLSWEKFPLRHPLTCERTGPLQAPGRCRGSRRVVLKAAPFIGEQRGVLLKAVCKPTFAVRSRDKEFEA